MRYLQKDNLKTMIFRAGNPALRILLAVMVFHVAKAQWDTVQFRYHTGSLTSQGSNPSPSTGRQFPNTASLFRCARACFDIEECTNFAWNQDSKDCFVGYYSDILAQDGANPNSGHLAPFHRVFTCRPSLGYQVRHLGPSRTPWCIQFMAKDRMKDLAEEICTKHHGSLLKINTREKLLYVTETKPWTHTGIIGLDASDAEKEGTFVWGDGQEFTQEEKGFFCNGETDVNTQENWVALSDGGLCFQDLRENAYAGVACEM